MTSSKAWIAGCSGHVVTDSERAFFADERPWGFILFKRNVDSPSQVRDLVASLRDSVGRPNAPVLIDQEGGRVQRLGPPHWRSYPPARAFGHAAETGMLHRRALAWLGARLIAHDLHALGITVDCLPVLDVPVAGAHDVIGNRAYSERPDDVAIFGRAASEGLLAGGVLPVIKHIPGHGRAGADSHFALPVVDTDAETLDRSDFVPFRHLADMPMAMTAHVVYAAIDPQRPATTSHRVIQSVIRQSMRFDGLLMSDDLSMRALDGSFAERTRDALTAGCDVVLHCNGSMSEMKAIVAATPELTGDAARRAAAALSRIAHRPEPFDPVDGWARLQEALATAVA